MRRMTKSITMLLLSGLFFLQGCFSASEQIINIKTTLLENGRTEEIDDTDIPVSDINNDEDNESDEFNFSIGPVGLFFTYGLVYLLSPLDEVDMDMAKDVLNNIDGLSISTSALKEKTEMPTKAVLEKLKRQLAEDGYQPIVINRDKTELNLIYLSDDFDDDGGEMLIVNFDENELNIITISADFEKIIEIASRYKAFDLGDKISFK